MTRLARGTPQMLKPDHRRLARMVEGAVVDAFRTHPDYLTDKGRTFAVRSITKRVVGTLAGYANQARQRSRLGGSDGVGSPPDPHRGAGRFNASRTRFPALHVLLCGGGR